MKASEKCHFIYLKPLNDDESDRIRPFKSSSLVSPLILNWTSSKFFIMQ